MSYEVREVNLELPPGELIPAMFVIWEEAPEDPEMIKVSLQFNAREITSTDEDFFSALCSIRRFWRRKTVFCIAIVLVGMFTRQE